MPFEGLGVVDLHAAIKLSQPEVGTAVAGRISNPLLNHLLGLFEPVGHQIHASERLVDGWVAAGADPVQLDEDIVEVTINVPEKLTDEQEKMMQKSPKSEA